MLVGFREASATVHHRATGATGGRTCEVARFIAADHQVAPCRYGGAGALDGVLNSLLRHTGRPASCRGGRRRPP